MSASPSTVISEGLGSFGSVHLLITDGFGIGVVPIKSTPFYRPASTVTADTFHASTVTADTQHASTTTTDIFHTRNDEEVQ